MVKGFRKKEIATLARRDLAAGSNVVSDGLRCWRVVTAAGCDHFPMNTGSGPNAAKWIPFTPAPSLPALASRSEPQGRLGQHRARQHQDRARGHVPSRQRQARPALPLRLRLALQPRLPAGYPDRALGLRLCTNRTAPIPGHHRRMSDSDNQVKLWLSCQFRLDAPPRCSLGWPKPGGRGRIA